MYLVSIVFTEKALIFFITVLC